MIYTTLHKILPLSGRQQPSREYTGTALFVLLMPQGKYEPGGTSRCARESWVCMYDTYERHVRHVRHARTVERFFGALTQAVRGSSCAMSGHRGQLGHRQGQPFDA